MLTLTFLGVGAAFAKRNYQSNALLEAWRRGPDQQTQPDDSLLIDFGATGPLALHTLKNGPGFSYLRRGEAANYLAIRRLFITHLHTDHVGGLEEFAFAGMYQRSIIGTGVKPQMIAARQVLADLWEHTLYGGLSVMNGRRMSLSDYFEPAALDSESGGTFRIADRYELQMFPTDHIRLAKKYDWPSYGLLIRNAKSGQSVVYSGDTRFDPQGLGPMLEQASAVFHEVQLEPHENPVHALLDELLTLPAPVRQKMILYHYGDSWNSPAFAHVAREFRGFAQPQRRYVLFE